MVDDAKPCLNCGEPLRGAFCAACGQAATVQRLTTVSLVAQLFKVFTNLDRGLFHTAFALTTHPGKTIAEYVLGRRITLYNPISYLLLVVGLWLLFVNLLGLDLGAMVNHTAKQMLRETSPALQQRLLNQMEINRLIMVHYDWLTLLLIPVFSFWYWLLLKPSGRNYAENLVFQSYTRAQVTLLFVVPTLLFFAFPALGGYYSWTRLFAYFLFQLWAGRVFYTMPLGQYLIRNIIAMLLSFVTFGTLAYFAAGVYFRYLSG